MKKASGQLDTVRRGLSMLTRQLQQNGLQQALRQVPIHDACLNAVMPGVYGALSRASHRVGHAGQLQAGSHAWYVRLAGKGKGTAGSARRTAHGSRSPSSRYGCMLYHHIGQTQPLWG